MMRVDRGTMIDLLAEAQRYRLAEGLDAEVAVQAIHDTLIADDGLLDWADEHAHEPLLRFRVLSAQCEHVQALEVARVGLLPALIEAAPWQEGAQL